MPARSSSSEKVRSHRARKRAQGMKLVQHWVPDLNAPAFRAEARRQSRLLALGPAEAADQAFVDSISDL